MRFFVDIFVAVLVGGFVFWVVYVTLMEVLLWSRNE